VRSRKPPHHGKHNLTRQTTQTEPQPNQALTPIHLPLHSALLLSISPPQKSPPSPQRWPAQGGLPAAPAGAWHRAQGFSSSPLTCCSYRSPSTGLAGRRRGGRCRPHAAGRGYEAALPPTSRAAYVAGQPAAPLTDAGELVPVPRVAATLADPPRPCPPSRMASIDTLVSG
jgi:hypothetical protein